MVAGLPLLLAALVSAAAPPDSSSRAWQGPECADVDDDELGGAGDEEAGAEVGSDTGSDHGSAAEAAADEPRDGELLTRAEAEAEAEADERDCSEPPATPPAVPAVIDCNDHRASVWVQEMIGSCDMPRSVPHASLRNLRSAGAVICDASGCWREPPPMRAVSQSHDGPPRSVPGAIRFAFDFPSTPVVESPRRMPAPPPPRRADRPPRS